MPWDADKQKLLCHVVLDDAVAESLGIAPKKVAFFRAFIVQDRNSAVISMTYRFRYTPDEAQWYGVTPKEQKGAMQHLCNVIGEILQAATVQMLGHPLPDGSIKYFYPPDDSGDPLKALEWLKARDLIQITRMDGKPGEVA